MLMKGLELLTGVSRVMTSVNMAAEGRDEVYHQFTEMSISASKHALG